MTRIQYLIMDVDGTLTDGKIYISENGECFKAFNVKDGYGIATILNEANIEPLIITGRKSEIINKRCKELGISKIYQGITDKETVLDMLFTKDELVTCAYIGDDIPDLEIMKKIKKYGGFTGCPNDAINEIRKVADYVCERKAGDGAAREFIEWLVKR